MIPDQRRQGSQVSWGELARPTSEDSWLLSNLQRPPGATVGAITAHPGGRLCSANSSPLLPSFFFMETDWSPLAFSNRAGLAFSKVLGHLKCWETVLHPFSLIGRNMLPVFCSQIGLSMLLIGIIPSPTSAEPFSSILVICQLLTAFLLARFFEWVTQKKKLLGASTEHFAANHRTLAKVQTPA